MSGSISFSGISSGIDTESMISQLVSLERVPVNQMRQQKSDVSSRIDIIQDINSKLQSLQTKATEMDTAGEFLSYEVSVSEEDVLTGTASGDASPGVYDVGIDALAKAERTYSDGFAKKDEAGLAGEGTLSITVGSEDTVDIEIDSDDTIETIVSKINASGASVSAGLINTGTEYMIQVNGDETGAENAIEFSEGGTLILNLDESSNQYQAAQDASMEVDGHTVTSSTNEITSAIPGVTMNIEAVTSSSFEVSISPESEAMEKKVKDFVEAYNAVTKRINDEFEFNGSATGEDRMSGDSTLRSLQRQLGMLVSEGVSGLDGAYTNLSQIGISTENSGELSIDEDELSEAVLSDPSGVAELFSGFSDGTVEGISSKMDSLVEQFINYSDGILTAKENSYNDKIDDINNDIERAEERISDYEETLRMKFTKMEVTMSELMSQQSYLSGQMGIW